MADVEEQDIDRLLANPPEKVVVKDLNPKIDMQLYEPGTHTVQVQLTKIKNMSIEKNVSAKITVE